MESAVTELLRSLLEANSIGETDIVSVIFSQTRDLDADNPARCARTDGFSGVPLFCTQEPDYPNSLPRVVRVLLTAEREEWSAPAKPVYIGGAEALRPDLHSS
jgi:chorismate mutase